MDKEIEKELKEMYKGFEEMKNNGELPNIDIGTLMPRMKKSLEEEKTGKLHPIDEVITELKSKYLNTEVC